MHGEGEFDLAILASQRNDNATMGVLSPIATATATATMTEPARAKTTKTTTTTTTTTTTDSSMHLPFSDSAIDMDTESSGNADQTPETTTIPTTRDTMNATGKSHLQSLTTITTTMIKERLIHLTHLITDSDSHPKPDNRHNKDQNSRNEYSNSSPYHPPTSHATSPSTSLSWSPQKSIAINRYLDGIEALLLALHITGFSSGASSEEEEEEEEEEEKEKKEVKVDRGENERKTNHCCTLSNNHHDPRLACISLEAGCQNANTKPHNQNQIQTKLDSQLDDVIRDLKVVTGSLEQRRAECLHLNAVFTMKCEKLAQRILDLEEQMEELRAKKIENTIELEGLKGTVRGLEGWIKRWKMRQCEDEEGEEGRNSKHAWSETSDHGRGQWGKPGRVLWGGDGDYDSNDDDVDDDTLMDGVSAWLRDWRDVEEGFRIRARLRERMKAVRRGPGKSE